MHNKDFIKYEMLKNELGKIQRYCPNQYFTVEKCQSQTNGQCQNNKLHVDRYLYPCIHYFTGNCKYGMNCHFSHNIRRQVPRPEPSKEICRRLYYENNCPLGNKCKSSHNLREYPCYYNTVSKCRFTPEECRYSHDKMIDAPVVCFFDLMKGCNKTSDVCPNAHVGENVSKHLVYDGPI